MKIEWNTERIKRNVLPVDGIFVHPIVGDVHVVVNPDDRKVSIITVMGGLVDSFFYEDCKGNITLRRLSTMLTVRGLTKK